jgi:hypothetical protein
MWRRDSSFPYILYGGGYLCTTGRVEAAYSVLRACKFLEIKALCASVLIGMLQRDVNSKISFDMTVRESVRRKRGWDIVSSPLEGIA